HGCPPAGLRFLTPARLSRTVQGTILYVSWGGNAKAQRPRPATHLSSQDRSMSQIQTRDRLLQSAAIGQVIRLVAADQLPAMQQIGEHTRDRLARRRGATGDLMLFRHRVDQ